MCPVARWARWINRQWHLGRWMFAVPFTITAVVMVAGLVGGVIVVVYRPPPPALWLLLAGGVGIWWLWRTGQRGSGSPPTSGCRYACMVVPDPAYPVLCPLCGADLGADEPTTACPTRQ